MIIPARGPTAATISRAVAGLVLAGLVLAGCGTAGSSAAPATAPDSPSAAAPSPSTNTPATPSEGRAGTAVSSLPESAPVSMRIASIGVRSAVNRVGLNPDRTMQVPQPGPEYDQAAWYRFSPTPGETGPATIIGHVDSAADGPSIFAELAELTPGARVQVTRADQRTVTFAVDAVRTFSKDDFPREAVYGDTAGPELRLITCSGDFDGFAGSYEENTVVFARMIR